MGRLWSSIQVVSNVAPVKSFANVVPFNGITREGGLEFATGMAEKRIPIGISSCLLGEKVRYNGEDKYDAFIVERIRDYLDVISVCPEVQSGLPIPREPMVLKGTVRSPRLVALESGFDYTGIIEKWAKEKIKMLEKEGICGFIFKSDSPSCGLKEVKIRLPSEKEEKRAKGIFAKLFVEYFSDLPVAEEVDLHSVHRLNNFIQKVYAYAYKKGRL